MPGISSTARPIVYLAYDPAGIEDSPNLDPIKNYSPPAILVASRALKAWKKVQARFPHRRGWMYDSGAFSAFTSGKPIEIADYIDTVRELQATDADVGEIAALDVIGDWRASVKNYERIAAAGIVAFPTYHYGEPIDLLKALAKEYPKIALGGVARKHCSFKLEWAKACFTEIWPARIHGFGFGAEKFVLALPFDSVDSSTWSFGCRKFHDYANGWGKIILLKGKKVDLRHQIRYYLDIEIKAQKKWKALFDKTFDVKGKVK